MIARLELACEEALVNIISYAYPEKEGAIVIECTDPEKPGLKISLRDQGIPYDPLDQERAPPTEDRLGGYGIPLIIKIMDRVQYQREENDNVLTLVKYRERIK